MPTVVDILAEGVRKQVENIREFLTTPAGPFETADKMVKQTRSTVRRAVESVGVRIPTVPKLLRGRRA